MLDLIKTIDSNVNYQGELNVNSLIKSIQNNPQELERVRQAFDVPFSSNDQINVKEMASHIVMRFNENRKKRNVVYQQIEDLLKEKRYEEAELMAYRNIGAVKYNQLISLSQRYVKMNIIYALDKFGIKRLIERGDFRSADEKAQGILKGSLLQEHYHLIRKSIADAKASQMKQLFDMLVREKKWSMANEKSEELLTFLGHYDTKRAEMYLKEYNVLRKTYAEQHYIELAETVRQHLYNKKYGQADEIYSMNAEILKPLNYHQIRDATIKMHNKQRVDNLQAEIAVLLQNYQFEKADELFYENEKNLKDYNYKQLRRRELVRFDMEMEKGIIEQINQLLQRYCYDEADLVHTQNLLLLKEFNYEKRKNEVIELHKNHKRIQTKQTIRELILQNEMTEANRLYDDERALLDCGDFHKEKAFFFDEVNNEKKERAITLANDTLANLSKDGDALFRNQDDRGLIDAGNNLIKLLIEATVVPEQEIGSLCELVVAAHLNHNDVLAAIEWINSLPVTIKGIGPLKSKLKRIEKQQQGIDINNITDTFLLNNLAKLHKNSKAYKKAEILYLKSLDLDDKNTYTLNGLGGVCRVAGKHQDGIKYYNRAFQLKKEAIPLNGLGAIYRELGQLCSAEKHYNDALEIDYANNYSHNGIGAVLFDQENYDEGRIHFDLASYNINDLFLLSEEYQDLGLIEKAIECLNIIVTKDQSNARAINQLSKFSNGE